MKLADLYTNGATPYAGLSNAQSWRSSGGHVIWILLAVVVLAVIFVISMYNGLVSLKVQATTRGPISTFNSNAGTT